MSTALWPRRRKPVRRRGRRGMADPRFWLIEVASPGKAKWKWLGSYDDRDRAVQELKKLVVRHGDIFTFQARSSTGKTVIPGEKLVLFGANPQPDAGKVIAAVAVGAAVLWAVRQRQQHQEPPPEVEGA